MNGPSAGEWEKRSFAPSNWSSGELEPDEDAEVDADAISLVPSVEGGFCCCWGVADLEAFKGDVTPFPDPGVNLKIGQLRVVLRPWWCWGWSGRNLRSRTSGPDPCIVPSPLQVCQ